MQFAIGVGVAVGGAAHGDRLAGGVGGSGQRSAGEAEGR